MWSPERRRWVASVAAFVVVMAIGAWPSISVRRSFSAAYAGVANVVLGALSFGRGGHARLEAMEPSPVRRAGENVTSDARLILTIDGLDGSATFAMSLRRDAHLPLLIVLAAIVAAPLGLRGKLRGLLVGLPVVFALTLGSIWLLVEWLFTHEVGRVYPPRPIIERGLDLVFRALLLPPGNRFLVPFVIAFGLVVWQRKRRALATV